MDYKKLKKIFGFAKDNRGIMSRFIDEGNSWNNHLQNTKKFILENIENKSAGLCTVLGSGWCLDVPLNELTDKFEKVILIDLVHPPQIKRKANKFSNLELLTYDISGVLEHIYNYKKKNMKRYVMLSEYLNFNAFTEKLVDLNPDCLVSVNILSQLAYFPLLFAEKNKLADSIERNVLKKRIEEAHINMLFPEKSVLITDYFETEYNLKGENIREKNRLSITLPKDKIKEEWIWDFDLSGNFHTGNPVRFKVAALQV
ncbi:MAG: hypothetical protein GXO50_04340 [Chlorobi bacterium]|nr:hypothetical protein [Chlorobiota bacterium]